MVRSNSSYRCPSESSTWPTLPFSSTRTSSARSTTSAANPDSSSASRSVQDGLDLVAPRPGVAVVHEAEPAEVREGEGVLDRGPVGRHIEPPCPSAAASLPSSRPSSGSRAARSASSSAEALGRLGGEPRLDLADGRRAPRRRGPWPPPSRCVATSSAGAGSRACRVVAGHLEAHGHQMLAEGAVVAHRARAVEREQPVGEPDRHPVGA
jgi:hypothetical protein